MRRVYAGSYVSEQSQGTKRVSEQSIGYELEVFSYTDLFWHPRKNGELVPGGKLQEIFRADIGDLVANFVLSVSPQDGFNYAENKARFPSKKAHKEKNFLLPVELREVEQYVHFIFVARKQEFIYNFKLRQGQYLCATPIRISHYPISFYRWRDERKGERTDSSLVQTITWKKSSSP